MKRKLEAIIAQVVPRAIWHWPMDRALKRTMPAIGALNYFRLYRTARVDEIQLHPVNVMHAGSERRALPAEVAIDAWMDAEKRWTRVRELRLPKLRAGAHHKIDVHGLSTRCIKMYCLRHHPTGPSNFTQWTSPFNVPYPILKNTQFLGRNVTDWRSNVPVAPELTIVENKPVAPRGMKLLSECDQVTYTSGTFCVAFSLRRPLMTRLGWDSARAGRSSENLLAHRAIADWGYSDLRIASGPIWNTLDWDTHGRFWGGEVRVRGNRVEYRGLHLNDEVSIDAAFIVRADGLDVTFRQHTRGARETIDLEPWRLVWNGRVATVATLGMPRQDADTRTGATELPVTFSAPGYGNLSVRQVSGGPSMLQVDSWRAQEIGWAGFVLGLTRALPHTFEPGASVHEAAFEWRVCDLLPSGVKRAEAHPELRRNWGPGLMFRPELAGFSNNAFSTNCHLSQTGVTDLAAATGVPKIGPSPIELARYTVTMALKNGRGYGDHRLVYQDSDPSLLNAAGRVQQASADDEWVRDIWPFVRQACDRILGKIDKTGLVVAPLSSGNTGAPCVSSNAWDCVNFGHYDAYSNVETYRALRNSAGLARVVSDDAYRARLLASAADLKRGFVDCFLNPATGWFASWRSRDGKLHDHGMLCINAPACLYGMVSRDRAKKILARMEATRIKLRLNNFRYGLPSILLPIERGDYLAGCFGQSLREDGLDSFGVFCNGMLTLGLAQNYIRAMSVFGFKETADQIACEVLEGYALGRLVGGINTGVEFHTFEGMPCGYEGAYVLQFPALLSIAMHLRLVQPFTPEFWLE